MGKGNGIDNEVNTRRNRVRMYKRIIVFFIVFLILLPTTLCVILFFKVEGLKSQIQEIKISSMKTDNKENTTISIGKIKVEKEQGELETESITEVSTEVTSDVDSIFYSESELVANAISEGRKVVYLTFDDGPGENTEALLDILDDYGVKATFFIVGNRVEGFESTVNRIIEEGHSLGMHSYTHNYADLYFDLDNFVTEINLEQDELFEITGEVINLFRFPGGSSNSLSAQPISLFVDYLNEQNIVYYDWNVSSGDSGGKLTAENVYDNVMSGIEKQEVSVVLMHDSTEKQTTFDAVPQIIETLQAEDALILPITADTEPVHHNVN